AKKDDETLTMLIECNVPRAFTFKEIRGKGMKFTWTIKPENFAVANAVGAAIGQISGEVDRIFSLANLSREEALADARKEATEKAIAAGAKPETIELLDQEDVPLAYLPGNATRIRLKVVGELDG
ncbi:MAG: hypothetical protein ACO23R_16310, partial [bacterium]